MPSIRGHGYNLSQLSIHHAYSRKSIVNHWWSNYTLGIVLIVGGAATANLDPSKENYYSGNGGDTWTVPVMISMQFILQVQSIVNHLK